MAKRKLYKGADQSALRRLVVPLGDCDIAIDFDKFDLLVLDNIAPAFLRSLYLRNDIRKNDPFGYVTASGLNLYIGSVGDQLVTISVGEVQSGLYEANLEAVFDPAAEDPRVRLAKFYRISYASDPLAIGAGFPQIVKMSGANAEQISEAQRARSISPDALKDQLFIARLGAKQTDIVSSAFYPYAGLFIGPSMSECLSEKDFVVHPVEIQFTNDVVSAAFLPFQPAQIDYRESTFAVLRRNEPLLSPETFHDQEEHVAAAGRVVLDDISAKLVPVCLSLHPSQRVVSMPGMSLFLINQETYNLIKGVTGCVIEPYEKDIFEIS